MVEPTAPNTSPSTGQPDAGNALPVPVPGKPVKGTFSLVLALLPFPLFLADGVLLAPICVVAALVLGHLARRAPPNTLDRELGLVGLIIGYASLIPVAAALVWLVAMISGTSNWH
ncbi:hypothetical protein [Chitiniphilus eburneus]|uniref:DUF4190 domain-containing protein n=1 Tax=Chitiniphilus eburneus TaxID=2571148 RepID=A0A4U0PRX0_9NEIS|nr:hypothetical protein [Chitiniphilus eburneus]TJZ71047.1 hypothetical protein FAZ21_13860 [Chitiniphilus eburneus]